MVVVVGADGAFGVEEAHDRIGRRRTSVRRRQDGPLLRRDHRTRSRAKATSPAPGEIGEMQVARAQSQRRPAHHVLPGVEGVGDAEVALRTRHQLHQALGSGGRLRSCAVPGLDGDDGVHQVGVDAVPLGSVGAEGGRRLRPARQGPIPARAERFSAAFASGVPATS